MSSEQLLDKARAHREAADVAEAKAFRCIEERLGFLLMRMDVGEEELLQQFDANNDGVMNKAEFRSLVRTLGSSTPGLANISAMMQPDKSSDAEIDALFSALDIDGSASLEVREIGIAFSKLKGALRRQKYADRAARVERIRAAAVAHDQAAVQVKMLEVEQKALDEIIGGTVKTRLGDCLKEKNIKVSDLKAKWDADGNGKLDRPEFCKNIRSLGFEKSECTDAEMHELFDELDADSSGSLASKELVASLKQLLLDSQNKQANEAARVIAVAQARKTADRAQVQARSVSTLDGQNA